MTTPFVWFDLTVAQEDGQVAARRSGGAASQQRHGGLSSVTGRHPRTPHDLGQPY